jgi:hypothetical protein
LGPRGAYPDAASAREQLPCFSGLAGFLHFLDWACGMADKPDRLARLARAFCERLQQLRMIDRLSAS